MQPIKENIKIPERLGLPPLIAKEIENGKTSLSGHPAFPPEEEIKFEHAILSRQYEKVIVMIKNIFPDADKSPKDIDSYRNILNRLMRETEEIEKPLREQLESICLKTAIDIFNLTDRRILIDVQLTDDLSASDIKMIPLKPESTGDVEFEGIDEIKTLSDEVYKRRLTDALMNGAADFIISKNIPYSEINSLNPKLTYLYTTMYCLNLFILFNENINTFNDKKSVQGAVSEVIIRKEERSSIRVKGINFISLYFETVKAILDLVSFHGLPQDFNKMQYILKKADFQLANPWDFLLGRSLWEIIMNALPEEKTDDELNSLIPFLFYELIRQPAKRFDGILQDVFASTKRGKKNIENIYNKIIYRMEKEDFDNEMQKKRNLFLTDGNYMSPNEF
jgi:hypothetical protein